MKEPGIYCAKCHLFVMETDSIMSKDGSWIGWTSSHPTKCIHCGAREFDVICEKAKESLKNEKRTTPP